MTPIGNVEAMEKVLSDILMRRQKVYATYVELSEDCSNLERLIERERSRAGAGPMVLEPHEVPPPDGILTCPKSADQREQEPSYRPESEGRSEIADDEEIGHNQEVPGEAKLPIARSISGYPLDIDVSGAETRMDMIRILAKQLPDQTFILEDAAQWLIDIGASSSRIKNLKSAFYGYAKGRSDYRKVEPGVYQYVGFGDVAEVIPFGGANSERTPTLNRWNGLP